MTRDAREMVSAHVYLLRPDRAEPPLITSQRWPRDEVSLAHLTTFARERWGTDAFVLHDGGYSTGAREIVVLLEARSEEPPLADRGGLFPRLPNSRPWQRPGWHPAALAWLAAALAEHGLAVSGAVTQVSTYDLACVLRAATGDGTVYLKAAEGSCEAAVVHAVGRRLPDCVPALLAARADGLFATRDSGRHLSESDDIDLWTEALAKLARIQRGIDASALTAEEIPEHDFADLPARASALLLDGAALEAWGLGPDALTGFAAVARAVEAAHVRVTELGLAPTFTHGDAHPMNALTGPDGVVWFDWPEACTAHPLLDAGWFFAWLAHPARSELPLRVAEPGAVERLWSSYLRELGAPAAEAVLDDAMALALAHRAALFHARFRDWQGTVPSWKPQYTPYYLRWLRRLTA